MLLPSFRFIIDRLDESILTMKDTGIDRRRYKPTTALPSSRSRRHLPVFYPGRPAAVAILLFILLVLNAHKGLVLFLVNEDGLPSSPVIYQEFDEHLNDDGPNFTVSFSLSLRRLIVFIKAIGCSHGLGDAVCMLLILVSFTAILL